MFSWGALSRCSSYVLLKAMASARKSSPPRCACCEQRSQKSRSISPKQDGNVSSARESLCLRRHWRPYAPAAQRCSAQFPRRRAKWKDTAVPSSPYARSWTSMPTCVRYVPCRMSPRVQGSTCSLCVRTPKDCTSVASAWKRGERRRSLSGSSLAVPQNGWHGAHWN